MIKLDQNTIKQYQTWLKNQGLSLTSIKRKLSSVRKFCSWAKDKKLIKKDPFLPTPKSPPSRLKQAFLRFRLPQSESEQDKKPQESKLRKYLTISIIIILLLLLGFLGYKYFLKEEREPSIHVVEQQVAVGPQQVTQVNRHFFFQGRLTDSSGNPITTTTRALFVLYSHPTESDLAKLWEELKEITPDQEGNFETTLGNVSPIPNSVFTDNYEVWLGIAVETNDEAKPRIQIPTVGYAAKAKTLEGFPLASRTDADPEATMGATLNTIPAINPYGNLVIAHPSPKIWSTSGTFQIRGQAVSLVTDVGTNGNIVLAPDGSGVINTILGGTGGNQFSILNSNLNSGSLIYGAVDNVGATEFNLLTLQSSADSSNLKDQFTVSATGDISANGAATVGGSLQVDTDTLFVDNVNNRVGIGTTAPSYTLGVAGDIGVDRYIYHNGDSDTFLDFEEDILKIDIGGEKFLYFSEETGVDTLIGNYNNANVDFRWDGDTNDNLFFVDASQEKVGIGTTNPGYKFDVRGSGYFSGDIRLNGQLQLGGFITNPTAIGKGALIYNTSDSMLYYNNDVSWVSLTQFWQRNSAALSPLYITDDLLMGATATSSALVKLPGLNNSDALFNLGTGNVGIGITNPTGELHIGGTTPQITIGDGGAEDTILLYDGNAQDFYIALDDTTDDLTIGTGSTIGSNVRMVIENGGNVGIGTTAPAEELHIRNDFHGTTEVRIENQDAGSSAISRINLISDTAAGTLTVYNDAIGAPYTDATVLRADDTATNLALVSSNPSGYINFFTGGSVVANERMRVTSDGYVGIGTTSPTYLLDVEAADSLDLAYTTSIINLDSDNLGGGLYISTNDDGASQLYLYDDYADSRVFEVSTVSMESDVPAVFNAAGDTTISYDLYFSNDTAAYIKSAAPLYIEAGDPNHAEDLVLRSAGTGDVIIGSSSNIFTYDNRVGLGTLVPSSDALLTLDANDTVYGLYLDHDYDADSGVQGLNVDVNNDGGSALSDNRTIYSGTFTSHMALTEGSYNARNYGLYSYATNDVNNAGYSAQYVVALYGLARNYGSGNLDYLWGTYSGANAYGTGTVTDARGTYSRVYETDGTITTGRAFYANCDDAATCYGLYIAAGDGQVTTDWGVYSTGEDKNYFSGNVGIGTTNPSGKLHVNGTLFANLTGAGATTPAQFNTSTKQILYLSSTVRHKENIEDLTFDKDAFFKLHPVVFDWKKAYGGEPGIGLIAEEVVELMPDMVFYAPKKTYIGDDGEVLRDENGNPIEDPNELQLEGVKYSRIPLYLFMIVKEHEKLLNEVFLTDTGDLQIDKVDSVYELGGVSSGKAINKIGVFKELVVANIKGGLGEFEEVEAENLVADITTTDLIKSISGDLTIQIQNAKSKDQNYNSKFKIINEKGEELASVDTSGTAKFKELIAQDIKTNNLDTNQLTTSTVSARIANLNKIYADEIVVKSIKVNEIILTDTGDIGEEQTETSTSSEDTGPTTEVGEADQLTEATFSGLLSQYSSEQIASSLNSLTQRIDILEQLLFNTNQEATLSANLQDTSDIFNTDGEEDIKIDQNLALYGNLNVLGKTVVDDLGITGKITAGLLTVDGLTAEINTLSGPLKLQTFGLGNVDIFGGKIVMSPEGNLHLKEGVIYASDEMRSREIVAVGAKEIQVDKEWNEAPVVVNVTPSWNTAVWVTDISETGFTMHFDTESSAEEKVYWLAVW